MALPASQRREPAPVKIPDEQQYVGKTKYGDCLKAEAGHMFFNRLPFRKIAAYMSRFEICPSAATVHGMVMTIDMNCPQHLPCLFMAIQSNPGKIRQLANIQNIVCKSSMEHMHNPPKIGNCFAF